MYVKFQNLFEIFLFRFSVAGETGSSEKKKLFSIAKFTLKTVHSPVISKCCSSKSSEPFLQS